MSATSVSVNSDLRTNDLVAFVGNGDSYFIRDQVSIAPSRSTDSDATERENRAFVSSNAEFEARWAIPDRSFEQRAVCP